MDKITNIFKMLSDETRLRIILLLSKEELCVCELSGILDVSQPLISRNLSKLKAVGLVMDDRREKFVFYRLRKDNNLLRAVLNSLDDSVINNHKFTRDLDRLKNKDIFMICIQAKTSNANQLAIRNDETMLKCGRIHDS